MPTVHYLSHPYAAGYGVAGRRLVLGLADLGVELSWMPIDFDAGAPFFASDRPVHPDLARHRSQPIAADVVVVHAIPEVIPALEHLRPPGAALVCHTVWEHRELQPHWLALLNRCDGVVVPTAWNDRKQPGAAIDAFTRAFGPDDDVVRPAGGPPFGPPSCSSATPRRWWPSSSWPRWPPCSERPEVLATSSGWAGWTVDHERGGCGGARTGDADDGCGAGVHRRPGH